MQKYKILIFLILLVDTFIFSLCLRRKQKIAEKWLSHNTKGNLLLICMDKGNKFA